MKGTSPSFPKEEKGWHLFSHHLLPEGEEGRNLHILHLEGKEMEETLSGRGKGSNLLLLLIGG
eukprot:2649388-Pyramimonas_sp.AAC.1